MRNRIFLVSALVGLFVAVGAAPALAGTGAESEKSVDSFSFFGMTFCMPDADEARCDVRLQGEEKVAKESEPSESVVNLLGYRICLGEVHEGIECDLRVPDRLPGAQERDRHARL